MQRIRTVEKSKSCVKILCALAKRDGQPAGAMGQQGKNSGSCGWRLAAGGGQAGRFAHGFLKMIFWLRSAARLRCFLGASSAMLGAARSVQGPQAPASAASSGDGPTALRLGQALFFLPPCQACVSVVLGPGRGRGKRSRGRSKGQCTLIRPHGFASIAMCSRS
jgi:hypothetical protein